jgi:nucleoside-diphosphate-sugar epimerase
VTVVVTGATGFLGSAVVRELLDDGVDVVAVDRRPGTRPAGARVLTADLLDADRRVEAALVEAEAVIHLAGCPGVRDDRPDVDRWRWRDNVIATERVLSTVPASVPLVVASSSSVYGGSRGLRPSREDDPLRPIGGYARSKVAVEALCAAAVHAGARVITARPFTVAGEGQRADMALSRWIAAARAGRPVQVYGSTARRRDVTDVRQVARALVALARLGVPGPVNVGTGVGHSLAEMLEAVASAVGVGPAVELLPASAEEVSATLADTTRLRSLVGWAPSTDLAALVRRQAMACHAVPRHPAVPA